MSEPKGHKVWFSVPFHPVAPPPKPSDEELEAARERARLTVLDLTARDKRFLKAMKIAY
jgi:hypothetical protein